MTCVSNHIMHLVPHFIPASYDTYYCTANPGCSSQSDRSNIVLSSKPLPVSRSCRSSNFLTRSARHLLSPRARNSASQRTVEGESAGISKSVSQDMEQSPALQRYLAEDDHWHAFLVTGEQASREQGNSLEEADKVLKGK